MRYIPQELCLEAYNHSNSYTIKNKPVFIFVNLKMDVYPRSLIFLVYLTLQYGSTVSSKSVFSSSTVGKAKNTLSIYSNFNLFLTKINKKQLS